MASGNGNPDSSGLSPQAEVAARAFVQLLARELSSPAASTSHTASASPHIGRVLESQPPVRAVSAPVRAGDSAQPVTNDRVRQAMRRQFPSMFGEQPRGKKRFTSPALAPCIVKRTDFNMYVLSGPSEFTPKGSEELDLAHAGLGKRMLSIPDNLNHSEIVALLEGEFPKLKTLKGGWMFYKSTGGSGRRKLSIIPTESEGYSTRLLKSASSNGKNIIFLVPLQEQLSTEPLPYDAAEFAKMPQSSCITCGSQMPLQLLPLHVAGCNGTLITSDEPEISSIELVGDNTTEICPICVQHFPKEDIQYHASFCGDGISGNSSPFFEDVPGEASSHTVPQSTTATVAVNPDVPAWKEILNASSAATLFRRCLLREQALETPIRFSMDIETDVQDREAAVIAFYKQKRTTWAAPLHCVLEGDAAIGDGVSRYFLSFAMNALQSGFHINFGNADVSMLFEGQKDHLIPCASQPLLDSDLFLIAGRLVGHGFIHGGPGLAGISRAVIHVLLGGPLETATLVLEDCPDLDQRNTIHLLEGFKELSEDQKADVNILTDMWELPRLTEKNRRYLHQQLLKHAILGRTSSQIKQMRKGLKETGVWPILTERRDVAEAVFPSGKVVICSPQVMIDHIIWPTESVDEEDEDYPFETRAKLGMFLRQFIETAPAESLTNLLRFWTGWEVISGELKVEVVRGQFPKSSTCYMCLRIPGHFSTYGDFKKALEASIGTWDTGFGLI